MSPRVLRLAFLLMIMVVVMTPLTILANSNGDFKIKYENQLTVNRGMIATDAMILTWFRQHQDYKKYGSIEARVNSLLGELKKAKQAHLKAKSFAKENQWRDAYEWAKKEWSHLNNIAVKGKKIQDNLKELESE